MLCYGLSYPALLYATSIRDLACAATLQNHTQETAFLVRLALKMCFPVFEFGACCLAVQRPVLTARMLLPGTHTGAVL
eukprot:982802-Rhodomonas_salina.1